MVIRRRLPDQVGSAKLQQNLSDFSDWRDQAKATGYHHRSVMRDERQPELSPEQRQRVAYEASLPLIENQLAQRAKLDASDFRTFAARGLIAAGISDKPADDIKAVMKMYREHGVRQDGEMVPIVFGRDVPLRGVERWSVTTERHITDERRVIELAKQLGSDISGGLSREGLDRAKADFLASRPHIDPEGKNWREQSAAIDAAGTGARQRGARIRSGDATTLTLFEIRQCGHSSGVQAPACG